MSQKATQKSAAKKAAVLGTSRRKNPFVLSLLGLCAALAIGAGIAFMSGSGAGSPQATATAAEATGGEVAYPASQFEGGKAQFFEYAASEGLKIRYFIVKSSDGVIRAAFDACDSCWPAGKGYQQEGDEMVCRKCGQRFPSAKVNEVKGGCNPAPLARTVRDGNVVIRTEDIFAGRSYFDLRKGG